MREEDIVCVGSDGLRYQSLWGKPRKSIFPKCGLYEKTFQAMCL